MAYGPKDKKLSPMRTITKARKKFEKMLKQHGASLKPDALAVAGIITASFENLKKKQRCAAGDAEMLRQHMRDLEKFEALVAAD